MDLKKRIKYLFSVLMLFPTCMYGQSNDEILKYLESTVKLDYRYVTNGALIQISDIELIEARIEVNMYNDEYGGQVISSYLVKQGGQVKQIPTPATLIELPEFYQTIKSSFKLKSPEDGLVLQTALNVICQEERNEGFFSVGTKWYFIRSDFFGSYFIAETDTNGNIIKIKHTKGIEAEIPDDLHFDNEVKSYPDFDVPEISATDKEKATKFAKENLDYRFEIEAGMSEFFNKISAAKFYEVKFIIMQKQGDEKYEGLYFANLITYNGKIISSAKIWETDLFLESTTPVFHLTTDADAKLFQDFLNEMESKADGVRFYKKDDLWVFVRDESFGNENGYIVKTNKKGNIECIGFSNFAESDFLRFRMQDPDFKVDYGFRLKSPTETTFTYNKEELNIAAGESGDCEYIEVEIEFNEHAVNAMGAWILTRFNGENEGVFASTNMTSPFTDNISVSKLEKGKHKVEYLLLRPGQETNAPLEIINLIINIE